MILRRMDEALARAERDPRGASATADVLYALGRVHIGVGNDLEARVYLIKANALMPTHHDISAQSAAAR